MFQPSREDKQPKLTFIDRSLSSVMPNAPYSCRLLNSFWRWFPNSSMPSTWIRFKGSSRIVTTYTNSLLNSTLKSIWDMPSGREVIWPVLRIYPACWTLKNNHLRLTCLFCSNSTRKAPNLMKTMSRGLFSLCAPRYWKITPSRTLSYFRLTRDHQPMFP